MDMNDFYFKIRNNFPEIAEAADADFVRKFDELDHEMNSLWFESLANSINSDMNNGISPQKYKTLFEFMRKSYLSESDEIKNCIDSSFIENLFWQVSKEKASAYWKALPDNLKELYVSFHSKQSA